MTQASSRFCELSARAVEHAGTNLCVGIDLHATAIPPFMQEIARTRGTATLLEEWASSLVEAAAGLVPAVKFQSAFFEAHGKDGWNALSRAIASARGHGLITILDAKRCDISSTMEAYGRMAFDVLGADVMTVLPWMGCDIIPPLRPWLERGRGLFLVLVSSNLGGSAVQLAAAGGATTVAEHIFRLFSDHLAEQHLEGSMGLVVGATKLEAAPAFTRNLGSKWPLLLPGLGVQGGQVTDSLKALLRASPGSLVPVSRAISGVGDPTHAKALAALKSWENYRDFARDQVQSLRKSLS